MFAIAAAAMMLFFGGLKSDAIACNAPGSDDLCTMINEVISFAGTNFAEIQGELDAEQTDMEEEDVFVTTKVLTGFNKGYVFPTFTEGKKKAQFWKVYDSKEASEEGLIAIENELKGCLDIPHGYKNRVDSGIHFFTSTKVNLQIMTKTEMDDDGEDLFIVLLQVQRH